MRVKAELDQMREGLRLHGCLAMMEEYPSLMEKLFVPGEDYTVRVFRIMCALSFSTLVNFSDIPGSIPSFHHFCFVCFSLRWERFAMRQAFQLIDVWVFGEKESRCLISVFKLITILQCVLTDFWTKSSKLMDWLNGLICMQVTSTFLMNSLTAEYSEPGSTRKLQETAVMAYFNRYVEERKDNCE